jgi:transposase
MEDRELYQAFLGLSAPWTVERVELKPADQTVEVWVGEQAGTRFACPECAERSPIYDRAERRWRHLDTCQFTTILCARVSRVACPTHGVKTVRVPWAEPGSRFTLLFERLAISWLREATPSAVARRLRLSWDEAEGILKRAVRRGLLRQATERARTPVTRIGIDEKSFLKRHQYVSLVVDLDRQRVLHVADDRKAESLVPYVAGRTEAERSGLTAIAMDMWEPYRRQSGRTPPTPTRRSSSTNSTSWRT